MVTCIILYLHRISEGSTYKKIRHENLASSGTSKSRQNSLQSADVIKKRITELDSSLKAIETKRNATMSTYAR